MHSNFLNFTKMQISALSQIVWLQLLCIALFPMFFNRINVNNDLANVIIYAAGLLMLSYLLLRNFAFNDAKYKTKLLFSILPVTPTAIIGARGIIIYLFCLIATPLLILVSGITHAIKPEVFAIVQTHILPYGLLLVAVFMPIEFLIFYMFETQKADIIGALAIFPYMALMAFLYNYLMNSPLWIAVFIIAIFTNVFCYRFSNKLYKSKGL
ncbi:ABC-2 transporter permease [Desulfosporosinus shakirovi]|uniref:ABC-2 transporter permease n=1 Tax=Desulfosporosinus shakirovi TaxID=2885154 RepID=UPI001E502EB4|nr:ABC-2 transporter permease [Desulfosporosinus sp. SRJS8]MCB8818034.1 ABC-2 transporter permease [Desulfosporosinus sp. SRJS8]